MRTQTINNFVVKYPYEIVFAFNPMPIRVTAIKGDSLNKIVVTVGSDYREEITAIDNRAETDISIFAKEAFDKQNYSDPKKRTYNLRITLNINGNLNIGALDFTVIWGAILPTETYNGDEVVRWFSNYPMTVETFANRDTSVEKTRDNDHKPYLVEQVNETGILSLNPATLFDNSFYVKQIANLYFGKTSVFDFTFDNTFRYTLRNKNIKLIKDTTSCGIFLRWVDKHGFLRYYLFSFGTDTTDSENSDITIQQDYSALGRYYDVSRPNGKSATRTINVAALNVPRDEFKYVRTICLSPIIDAFIGYDDDGKDLWLPVDVSGSVVQSNGEFQTVAVDITYKEPTQRF